MIEIIKFSRPGCVPCAALANYFTEINLADLNATLTSIDIADYPEAIDRYKLGSVPTLIFKRNGAEVHRIVGLRPVDELIDAIEHAKVVR
jgi:thioredoxin 1